MPVGTWGPARLEDRGAGQEEAGWWGVLGCEQAVGECMAALVRPLSRVPFESAVVE